MKKLILLLLLTSCTTKPAVQSWAGFDTFNYIFGSAQQAGYPTTDDSHGGPYADNAVPYPLSTVYANLVTLSAHNIRVAREIVPELALEDTSTYPAMAQALQAYEATHFTLLLALGRPAVGQNTAAGINCMSSEPWTQWAAALSRFLAYAHVSNVVIDPYNEFDSLNDGSCKSGFGTPQRAAALYSAMHAAMPAYTITTPSLATGTYAPYLTAYYAAGGGGCPDIHIYWLPGQTLAQLQGVLNKNINDAAGTAPQCKVWLGEYGMPPTDPSYPLASQVVASLPRAQLQLALWWDYMSPDEWQAYNQPVAQAIIGANQ